MVIAPSRDGGTNALLAWPPLVLPFLFGVGSQARHMAAARERGLGVYEFRAPGMELDVDRPDDLLRTVRGRACDVCVANCRCKVLGTG
jgi:2-phospho-L-lactate/phosphoenolpyruvate guanylyltransferase